MTSCCFSGHLPNPHPKPIIWEYLIGPRGFFGFLVFCLFCCTSAETGLAGLRSGRSGPDEPKKKPTRAFLLLRTTSETREKWPLSTYTLSLGCHGASRYSYNCLRSPENARPDAFVVVWQASQKFSRRHIPLFTKLDYVVHVRPEIIRPLFIWKKKRQEKIICRNFSLGSLRIARKNAANRDCPS